MLCDEQQKQMQRYREGENNEQVCHDDTSRCQRVNVCVACIVLTDVLGALYVWGPCACQIRENHCRAGSILVLRSVEALFLVLLVIILP